MDASRCNDTTAAPSRNIMITGGGRGSDETLFVNFSYRPRRPLYAAAPRTLDPPIRLNTPPFSIIATPDRDASCITKYEGEQPAFAAAPPLEPGPNRSRRQTDKKKKKPRIFHFKNVLMGMLPKDRASIIWNVVTPVDYRVWEHVAGSEPFPANHTPIKVTVMCYNVFSQENLNSMVTDNKDTLNLDHVWELRFERIFNEVLTIDPEVICFQEVEEKYFEFYKRFTYVGYQGVYKKQSNYSRQGCAILWRHSLFTLIEGTTVKHGRPDMPLLNSENAGIIVKIAARPFQETHLVVATTHLTNERSQDATRLAQMRTLISKIEKFSCAGPTNEQLPVILTGDFCTHPGSNVIRFLEEGRLRIAPRESLGRLGIPETRLPQPSTSRAHQDAPTEIIFAEHSLKFYSAYDAYRHNRNPEAWRPEDYIYYTRNNLQLVQRLGMPERGPHFKIPNRIYPSDHVSIVAQYNLFAYNDQLDEESYRQMHRPITFEELCPWMKEGDSFR